MGTFATHFHELANDALPLNASRNGLPYSLSYLQKLALMEVEISNSEIRGNMILTHLMCSTFSVFPTWEYKFFL